MSWVFMTLILYLIGMLIYVSIEFFGGASVDKISAFGSILGGIGTIFAAFVAIYLFNGWKLVEDHKTKNDHANNAVNSFLELQNFLKSHLIKVNLIRSLCINQTLSFDEKFQILSALGEFHHDITFCLRALKIHTQLFSTVSNNLILRGEFEQTIGSIESQGQVKFDAFISTIGSISSSPQHIMHSIDDYLVFTNGQLVVDLHLKVIIKLSRLTKALN